MKSQDFFNYTVSVGFIVLVIFSSLVAYRTVEVFRSVKKLIDRVGNAKIIDSTGSIIISGITGLISRIFGKRGDKNAKERG